jgi:hypothetical protein
MNQFFLHFIVVNTGTVYLVKIVFNLNLDNGHNNVKVSMLLCPEDKTN